MCDYIMNTVYIIHILFGSLIICGLFYLLYHQRIYQRLFQSYKPLDQPLDQQLNPHQSPMNPRFNINLASGILYLNKCCREGFISSTEGAFGPEI